MGARLTLTSSTELEHHADNIPWYGFVTPANSIVGQLMKSENNMANATYEEILMHEVPGTPLADIKQTVP